MRRESNSASAGARFPQTHRSAVVAAGSADPVERARALETVIAAYWKPVYKYVRLAWKKQRPDAADLTQAFFAGAVEKNTFQTYNPAKAKFRTFLRMCLDGFVANEEKAERRLKRGGGFQFTALDFETVESELRILEIPSHETPETYFEREWVRALLELALEQLKTEFAADGKRTWFELFEAYYLGSDDDADEPSYAGLSERFDLPQTTVTNRLAACRREFRRILLEKLSELTATDEEFRREARVLLGDDAP